MKSLTVKCTSLPLLLLLLLWFDCCQSQTYSSGPNGWSFFYLRAKAITWILVQVESENVEVNRKREG